MIMKKYDVKITEACDIDVHFYIKLSFFNADAVRRQNFWKHSTPSADIS